MLILFVYFFQLRGSEILPVVRFNKEGFPKSMSLSEFKRRFSLLAKTDVCAENTDDQLIVKNILLDTDIDESLYRIGLSEVSTKKQFFNLW